MKKRLGTIVLAIGFAAACGSSGSGGGGPIDPGPPPPTAVTVTTGTNPPPRFIPATVSVAVGGTVTWRNGSPDPVTHNVLSTTNVFASPILNPNETFQATFPQAGEFPYRCTIHEGMTGTIEVR